MTVSHRETELLLTKYVLGRLPDQEAQAVAKALAEDAHLRTLAEFLQWLLLRLLQLDRDPAEQGTESEPADGRRRGDDRTPAAARFRER